MTEAARRNHRLGLLLVVAAALCWSTSGVFIRSISADLMTMLFWRGLFSGGSVFLLYFLMEGRNGFAILRGLRWPAFAVMVFSATGMITGIGSMRFTGVADAMVIYATVPFMTAGLAYLFIGERPSRSTMTASVLALAGVGIMLWGQPLGSSLFGQFLAFLMTLSMASFTVIMRRHQDVAMLPAMAASGLLCAFFCVWFAAPLSVSAGDFGKIALFGIAQNAAGLAFYTFGSKRVPAAEATLLGALEVPLTPLWVFLLIGETPAPQTMAGGVVVLVALFGHIVLQFRGSRSHGGEPLEVAP